MTVSLCPTFFCAMGCPYCYLGALRDDGRLLPLDRAADVLDEISECARIDEIAVFGGEVSTLGHDYLSGLASICKLHCPKVGVSTNLADPFVFHCFDSVAVSLNQERPDYLATLELVRSCKSPFSVNMVVLPSVVQLFRDGAHVELFDSFSPHCKSVGLLEYSPSVLQQAPERFHVSNEDYEFCIKTFIEYSLRNPLGFENINLSELVDQHYSPSLFQYVFVGPDGRFGRIEFDERGLERFEWSDTFEKHLDAAKHEWKRYANICCKCEYFNNCYLQHVHAEKGKCHGHRELKRWVDDVLRKTYK